MAAPVRKTMQRPTEPGNSLARSILPAQANCPRSFFFHEKTIDSETIRVISWTPEFNGTRNATGATDPDSGPSSRARKTGLISGPVPGSRQSVPRHGPTFRTHFPGPETGTRKPVFGTRWPDFLVRPAPSEIDGPACSLICPRAAARPEHGRRTVPPSAPRGHPPDPTQACPPTALFRLWLCCCRPSEQQRKAIAWK